MPSHVQASSDPYEDGFRTTVLRSNQPLQDSGQKFLQVLVKFFTFGIISFLRLITITALKADSDQTVDSCNSLDFTDHRITVNHSFF